MSESKSDTARANGAKSLGPVTPEGKAKSALNSLRHGLSAKAIVVPGESEEDYQTLLAAHVERFQPADPIEMDLVEAMAVARWRLRRIAGIEANMLTNAMSDADRHSHNHAPQDAPKDHDQRLARVFKSCASQIALLTRYEGSLNRTFDRALKQLQLLQKTRPLPPPPELDNELQNEPKPVQQSVEYKAVPTSCIENSSTSPSPAPPSPLSPSPRRDTPSTEPGTGTGAPPPPSAVRS